MAVSLNKGQGVSLRKADNDLSQVTIGLGWDVAEAKGGFFGSLFGKQPEEYDLDAIALVLGADGKMTGPQDAIFYNAKQHPGGAIWLTGDNRTGEGDGDDEQIIVKLDQVGSQYARILFVVSIYEGKKKQQHFGKVANAYIRAVDGKNQEIARYNISGNSALDGQCSLTFAELVRSNGTWSFNAIGTPHQTDRFVEVMQAYTK
ncbi:TerD family protein [Massilia sp. S19_KUP03_FR1]|uniref:TerD family protein n=1 Tax=Massilia sp. S19_KUP03_FR1 TaxID=3025503 RepID=UPI002FCCE849